MSKEQKPRKKKEDYSPEQQEAYKAGAKAQQAKNNRKKASAILKLFK